VHEVRCNLAQRLQDKTPNSNPRVGDRQLSVGVDRVIKEEKIEIQCPGTPSLSPNPAKPDFPLLEDSKEALQFTGCLDLDHAIQEPPLVRFAERLGLIQGRAGPQPVSALLSQPKDRLPKGGFTIPKVGAHAYSGQMHRHLTVRVFQRGTPIRVPHGFSQAKGKRTKGPGIRGQGTGPAPHPNKTFTQYLYKKLRCSYGRLYVSLAKSD
jgi:hypothetical protein